MGTQLALPASWARQLSSNCNPRDALAALGRDAVEAKAEIRAVLDRLAERHGIAARDVTYAMEGYVDGLLSDTVYNVERKLTREIEDHDPP